MAELWYPWCSTGDECCGDPVPHGNCFCCGEGFYEVPPGGNGGPLQWLVHAPATIPGSCFGLPCSTAAGDWYLDYVSACTWNGPLFNLCDAIDPITNDAKWVLSIGNYPACDANPVDRDAMRLSLVSGTGEVARWENPCVTRIGLPNNPRCDPPVSLTCNGPNTLVNVANLGVCWPVFGGISPPDIIVEPVW